MTAAGWVWVAVAAALAVLDWFAVACHRLALERWAKPAVLIALLLAAGLGRSSHHGVHGWLLLALGLGLLGDIALSFAPAGALAEPQPAEAAASERVSASGAHRAQPAAAAGQPAAAAGQPAATAGQLPAPPTEPSILFLVGLASFLLGHLSYCVAILKFGTDSLSLGFGLALVLLALVAFGNRILSGALSEGGNPLAIAVTAYIAALGSAVVLGVGTTSLWIAYGVVLFGVSDLVLAWDRFVVRRAWAPVTVAVSYHLAQFLLLFGLLH